MVCDSDMFTISAVRGSPPLRLVDAGGILVLSYFVRLIPEIGGFWLL